MDKKLISIVNFDKFEPNSKYFHLCAWDLKLVPWLPPKVMSMEPLQTGLNKYYHKVIHQFKELIEIQFVGSCKFLKLEYMEKKLTTQELNDLMFKIFKYKKPEHKQ